MTREELNEGNLAEIPDIYTDRMRVTVTVFGVNMTFGLSEPHPSVESGGKAVGLKEKVRIRMSLEHAKVTGLLLRKQLKKYEKDTETKIEIPAEVLKKLEIEEDW